MTPEQVRTIHTGIWRRVQAAAEQGKGVRLSVDEVRVLSMTDFAEDPCVSNHYDGSTPST